MNSQMGDFITNHRGLVIGGGLLLVLVIAGKYMSGKSSSTANGSLTSFGDTSNLGGIKNGLVYVPTSTTFETINQGAFSNDPNLKTVTNSGNTTSTSTTTTNNDQDGRRRPPGPNPPPTGGKSLKWDQRYTVVGRQTLQYIASVYTRKCRVEGMPTSMSISYLDIWHHNEAVIERHARMHGHHEEVWNWVYTGEVLIVPRWG